MAQIEIHPTPQDDGSVAVSTQLPDRRSEYVAPAPAVAAVRRSVADIMARFEARVRPLADPVVSSPTCFKSPWQN